MNGEHETGPQRWKGRASRRRLKLRVADPAEEAAGEAQIATAEVACLEEIRHCLETGWALEHWQCERLAIGFLSCNLIVDAVEILTLLVTASAKWFTDGIRYEDLFQWFAGLRKLDLDRVLRTLAGSEEILRDHNPWQCINRWLVIEALIRAAPQSQNNPAAMQPAQDNRPVDHAEKTFLGVLESARPPGSCQTRGQQVHAAFSRWWLAFAAQLAEVARQLRTALTSFHALSAEHVRQQLVPTLAVRLAPQTFTGLTLQKNIRLRLCLGRRNKPLARPASVPEGWIAGTFNQINSALQRRKDFHFDAGALKILASALAWTEEHNLTEKFGVTLDVLHAVAASPPGARITSDERSGDLTVRRLLDAWRDLFDLVRSRGIPANWADHRQMEDLFRHPLMHTFEFGSWKASASDFGLPASDDGM